VSSTDTTANCTDLSERQAAFREYTDAGSGNNAVVVNVKPEVNLLLYCNYAIAALRYLACHGSIINSYAHVGSISDAS